jgi:putative N6-adenine-specific DNA methylase
LRSFGAKTSENDRQEASFSSGASVPLEKRMMEEVLPLPQPLILFASCLPGLEPFLKQEMRSLGFQEAQSTSGGVHFFASTADQIFKSHLFLGTASHIYLRAGAPFRARSMTEVTKGVARLDFWGQYMLPNGNNTKPTLDIRVVASKSRLYHTKGIAERVEKGICTALGVNPDEKTVDKNPAIRLLVRVHRDMVQISVDTSTTPLHQRGYRLETAKAPLREDLAYALLYSAGFGAEESKINSMLDPFCGSGTIPIEAASMACNLPPGRLREAPLRGLTLQNDASWQAMVDTALQQAQNQHTTYDYENIQILGSDRNQGGIDIARRNAERAGVAEVVKFQHNAISSNSWLENLSIAPMSFLVATNPPFGHRTSPAKSSPSLLPLYQTLGHKIAKIPEGNVDVAILGYDVNLVRRTGIPNLKLQFTSKHGGLNVFALGAKTIFNSKTNT